MRPVNLEEEKKKKNPMFMTPWEEKVKELRIFRETGVRKHEECEKSQR